MEARSELDPSGELVFCAHRFGVAIREHRVILETLLHDRRNKGIRGGSKEREERLVLSFAEIGSFRTPAPTLLHTTTSTGAVLRLFQLLMSELITPPLHRCD